MAAFNAAAPATAALITQGVLATAEVGPLTIALGDT